MLNRREIILFLLGGVAAVRAPHTLASSGYPNRPIRMVVPYAPGGNTDLVARLYGESLSRVLGVPVVVENRAGAGTVVGTDFVARSPADGYTLLFGTSAHAINASLYPDLPYDPINGFVPLSLVAEVPLVLAVNPAIPVKSAKEFIQLLRKNPGKYTFASAGNGSALHMAGELLKYQEKLDFIHVPYRGAGPALASVIAGEVDFIIDAVSTATQFIKSGRLRALEVTSDKRCAILPDAPTMKESGFERYSTAIWNVVLAPTGISEEIIKKLSSALSTVANNPELRQKLLALGVEQLGLGPDAAAARIKNEIKEWGLVINAAGIKPQ